MSQYVDGELANGFDSALTWSDNHKTRFSPPKEGMEFLQGNYPDTLVFNPYNHQSDASGVATRYTLHSESDDSVNPEYPVEIKFTTRAQIIQPLSLGYISECEQKISDRQVSYTQENFMEELAEEGSSGRTDSESPEAYWLLKDIANVIEFMRSDPRFYYLFNRGDWDGKVRKALVSSPALLGDIGNAERFMANVFWDSADRLTRFYRNAEKMLNDLSREWEGCRVLATMEVGALLLDIDSFQSYVAPKGEKGQQVKDKVSRLAFERAGNEVHIFLRAGGSRISGEAFGCFQAICAELNVPLKRERLVNDPQKRHFAELAEKCDFLDFPGVSNKNTGDAVGNGTAEKINIDKADEAEVFTKVFKQGKTQCFVYNYAKKYGIDAFAVLVRTDRPPSKSSLLNTGISEWLCSFDERWTPGKNGAMPVFVNMTFFANLINSVSMNGFGGRFGALC